MKIYLVHPISGLGYDEVMDYYRLVAQVLESRYEILCPMVCKGYLKNEKSLAPSGIEKAPPSRDHAIFERDLWMVGQADVVYADLMWASKVSIGCMMELAWASQLRKHVVTAMEAGNPHWHSFVLEATDVLFDWNEDALDYLIQLEDGIL